MKYFQTFFLVLIFSMVACNTQKHLNNSRNHSSYDIVGEIKPAFSNHHFVKGVIMDYETREPLIGVYFVDRKRKNGAATDIDGFFEYKFEGEISPYDTIVIKYHDIQISISQWTK